MTAQVAADLRAAAEVLRRDGWTQGSLTDLGGCHCAAGALMEAADDYLLAISALASYIRESLRQSLTVVQFNDAPGRTADEVIAALEAAADAAEQQS